jgi:hypothetical protein
VRKNPDKKMRDLLIDRPATSEQVIHYEKFESGEAPTPIDLGALDSSLPADWTLYYANTLGEFDILLMFQTYKATERYAEEFAAGWSGCRWRGYRDSDDNLVIVGLSAWDSERDAAQFVDGYSRVLAGIYRPGEYDFIEAGRNVVFVVGEAGAGSEGVKSALTSLASGMEAR